MGYIRLSLVTYQFAEDDIFKWIYVFIYDINYSGFPAKLNSVLLRMFSPKLPLAFQKVVAPENQFETILNSER